MKQDPKNSLTSDAFDLNAVRLKIIRQTMLMLVIVGAPAIIASVARMDVLGFIPLMAMQIIAYIINFIFFLNLKHISLKWQTAYLITILFVLSLGSLITFGVAGASLFILASSCILTSYLLGRKIGHVFLGTTILVLIVLGTLFVVGSLHVDIDLNAYVVAPTSWILAIISLTIFVAIVVNGSGNIEEYLRQAIHSLKRHESDLQQLVQERTAKMEQALENLDGVLSAATQIGIIATDPDGLVTLFNSGAEEILGYKAEEVVGIHTPALWHKAEEVDQRSQQLAKDLGIVAEGFDVFVTRASLYEAERKKWTFITKSGEEKIVSLTVTAIRNNKSEIKGFLGCAIDITEKTRINKALKEQELRLQHMVDNVPGITYRCKMDADWTMSYISPAIENLLGYAAEEFIGNNRRSYASVIYPDDVDYVSSTVISALHQHKAFNIEYRVVDRHAHIHWVSERGQGVFDNNGGVEWIDGIIVDITEQKHTLNELTKSEARYSSIIENIPNVVMRLSTDGIVEFINRDFSCATKQQMLNKNVLSIVCTEHKQDVESAIIDVKRSHANSTVDAALISKEEGLIWHQLKIGPIIEEGQVKGLTLVATNINKRVEKEAFIKHLALHDHLTGLANRRLFEEKLDFYIKHSARSGKQFALLVMDLDNFKPVNDNYGHDFGDKLLQQLASRFSECIRLSDIVARLGGDEFAIVITEIAQDIDIISLCNTVISRINAPFTINGIQVSVGVSIGIAIFPSDAKDALSMVKKADTAMYSAKEKGRNQFVFYDEIQTR